MILFIWPRGSEWDQRYDQPQWIKFHTYDDKGSVPAGSSTVKQLSQWME